MLTPKQAEVSGYCITSRSGRHATRLDREDWKEFMAKQHVSGDEWVKCLGKDAADFYRRVYSKDTIIVPSAWLKLLPNSNGGIPYYVPMCN